MPNAYAAMGTTAEVVARRFEISREAQDEFAYNSHMKAVAAVESGKFADEIVPLDVRIRDNGSWKEFTFDTDEGPRADTTVEGLARLRPVFDPMGTVTAGNASQINDGAAAVVVMGDDKAKELGLEPIAYVRKWAVAGVDPDIMGIGPAAAVPKLLDKAGLDPRRHRSRRDQRGLCQPVGLLRQRARSRPREDQRQRRRHRHRPPARRHRRGAHRQAPRRAQAPAAKRGIVTMCIGGGMGFAYMLEMA